MKTSTLPDDVKELAAGYVLDELDADEMAIFEQMILDDDAVRQEVRDLQMALGGLSLDVPSLEPPAHLRTRTLEAIGVVEQSTIPAVATKKFDWSKVIALFSLVAVAALVWDNFRLRQDLSFAQKQTTDKVATLLQRPNSKLVSLSSQSSSNVASGTLLFTPGKWQAVVVSAQNLPPLPASQVYRLWLSLNNQSTIYCGEFRPDRNGSVSRPIEPPQLPPPGTKATGLFITVEQKDAAIAPTGERVMSGTI